MELVKFIFSDFWIFTGAILILYMFINGFGYSWRLLLRHLNIKKYGYPPEHCDADGDFKIEKK